MKRALPAILAVSLAISAEAFEPIFNTRLDYNTGDSTISIAAFDINFDGYKDIVTTNMHSDNVSLLMNNCDGTFGTPLMLAAGNGAYGMTTADFNHDGCIDIMVTDIYEDSICYLRHNGYAGYMAGRKFYAGHGPASIVNADFNSDGELDLAVTDLYDDSLRVFYYPTDDSLRIMHSYYVGNRPYPLAAADLDQDGDSDIISGSYDDMALVIFQNSGDGTFARTSVFNISLSIVSVTAAPIDRDGYTDLMISGYNGFQVLINNNDGTFDMRPPVNSFWGSSRMADLDNDGDNDIIGCSRSSNQIVIEYNDGAGNFTERDSYIVGRYPRDAIIADINNDGLPDLISSNRISNSVSVISSDINGGYLLPTFYPFELRPTDAMSFRDTRDSTSFLAIIDEFEAALMIFRMGAFVPTSLDTFVCDGFTAKLRAADFNNDGYEDLATWDIYGSGFRIFLNYRDSVFILEDNFDLFPEPTCFLPLDYDGDSDIDLVVPVASSQGYIVLSNDGTGHFPDSASHSMPYPYPSDIIGADFDHDGDQDFAVVFGANQKLVTCWNNITGFIWGQRTTIRNPRKIALSDLNNDSYLDIIALNDDSTFSFIMYDNLTGFETPIDFNAGYQPTSFTLADFDGDRLNDIVLGNSAGNNFLFYKNYANLTFTLAGTYGANNNSISVVAENFENDGIYHIAAIGETGISIIKNRRPAVSIDETPIALPKDISPFAYPNPFNPATIIRYNLVNAADINLTIYNLLGQKVATLFEGHQEAGAHTINWNAGDVASGVYFARLESPKQVQSIKMTLLK